jgi:ribose 5-phosphate isomerase B
MKLFIGCDSAGIENKLGIIELLKSLDHDVTDIPIRDELRDYPDIAKEVCLNVLKTKDSKGILICGTGMGMCLAANKIKGIRATLCTNVFSAQKSRSSNDANILTLGALTSDLEANKKIVYSWVQEYKLNPESARKVAKLMSFENLDVSALGDSY